ncbi:MAG: symmetrical bis(5'-nucleosyl)-tetraphosphatase [Pseudomonadota bacterium]|nr:symmetrical bis(5'-nucleosyl)-tetraphosphatase [Pseudomonadota bacterium]
MSVWAIGDLQGCYDATQRLLDQIAFDPARDRLWFCGDLVNRGGQSLETLRLVHSLRACSTVVLGNHDLSLLAIGARREDEQRKVNPDLQRVVFAPDAPELLDWLRMQKLVHVDRALGWMMVHAGLAPQWTTQMAELYAREVEDRLQGPDHVRLLRNMYGDGPAWHPRLTGMDRQRAIINILTRLRYCSPRGRIAYDEKGCPGTQPAGLYPWFSVPGRAERDLKIACGHWSTLGLFMGLGVHALDTGAVWGGRLTALQLDTDEVRVVQVPGREVPANAAKPRSAHRLQPSRSQRERPAGTKARHERRQGRAKPKPDAGVSQGSESPRLPLPPKVDS